MLEAGAPRRFMAPIHVQILEVFPFHELENRIVDFQAFTIFQFMVREQVRMEQEATLGTVAKRFPTPTELNA